jgi:high-affinity K+ transport system ATPase subunit B
MYSPSYAGIPPYMQTFRPVQNFFFFTVLPGFTCTRAMMTLIGLAIFIAYAYSSAVVLGLEGKMFFWELATLIIIMLLGHWIEMRSVMGASGALEELVKLIPSTAHRITADGGTEEVKVSDIKKGDKVAVKPGEKIPTDGVITDGPTSIRERPWSICCRKTDLKQCWPWKTWSVIQPGKRFGNYRKWA